MELKTAQIDFRLCQKPLKVQTLTAAFAFSEHRGAMDLSTNTYQESNQGFSWLGVRTEPFDGWPDTGYIDFCFPDEAYGYYVVYLDGEITQDGEWLWFPVTRSARVSTYQD
ncbi:hypothetical protein AO391_24810 [Pseudomonas marginalis ICMP 9505]|nr:hypothetical protein AO391_24810 [Pseudomonas marginalis ICMP 9505]